MGQLSLPVHGGLTRRLRCIPKWKIFELDRWLLQEAAGSSPGNLSANERWLRLSQ